jgi:hypothetical protein
MYQVKDYFIQQKKKLFHDGVLLESAFICVYLRLIELKFF